MNRALTVLATSFSRYYREFAATGFDAGAATGGASLLDRLRGRMSTLGAALTIHLPGGETFRGTGVELTAEGELVVRSDSGEERSFTVGDVVHVRPQGYGAR